MTAAPTLRARVKRATLHTLKGSGAFTLCADSRWRRDRLVILCYHGFEMDDESAWDPHLYVSAAFFERRLQVLRDGGYNVLPFGEAVRRLYAGTLPERSVCLTVDDGMYDFRAVAWPLLKRYGMPATIYVSTYYSEFNRPVFNPALRYVLWRARDQVLEGPVSGLAPGRWNLADAGERFAAFLALHDAARDAGWSGREKDALLDAVAARLGVDLAAVSARRMLHIMSPDELAALAADGADLQLHTHTHRSPLEEQAFRREIVRNQELLTRATGEPPRHFCYPSGFWRPEFLGWLAALGIETATTGDHALASRASHPLALPRVLDHMGMSDIEFEGWLAGVWAVGRREPGIALHA